MVCINLARRRESSRQDGGGGGYKWHQLRMVKQMRIGAGHDGGDADELTGDSVSYPNRYCT